MTKFYWRNSKRPCTYFDFKSTSVIFVHPDVRYFEPSNLLIFLCWKISVQYSKRNKTYSIVNIHNFNPFKRFLTISNNFEQVIQCEEKLS